MTKKNAPHNAELQREARGWLTDCGMNESAVERLSDAQIQTLVNRQYSGGWSEFASGQS